MTPGLPRLRIAFHSIILRSGWRITFVAVPLLALLFLPRALLAQPDPSLVSLFENSGVVMLLIEPESGAIIRANSSAARFYGHSQQELQSMAIQDINTFTPEQVKKERLRAARENRNFFIFRHRLSDGRVKRVEVYSHPIVYRGRQVLFSIIHDVSDERFMQETVEHYNRQLEGQVDERTEELRTYQYFLIALAILQFLVIAALVYTRARRKKAERALEKLNQELEKRIRIAVESIREKESIIHEREKRRARDDLLIDLAHQWRQPLNAAALEVQNIGDLLEGAPGAAKIEELIGIVMEQLTELSSTLSRLTGFYERESALSVGIKEGLKKSRDLSERSLKSRGIEVIDRVSPDCLPRAEADEWVNLFSTFFMNVREIKEARGLGSARITVESRSDERATYLIIEDNAGGIDPTLLPRRLFEPYTTTHFRSRDKGLGLYTVFSMITYRFNGEIEAENTPVGARFTIRIPHGRNEP
tara:strand:- start:316292 stop:317716 length:1425 start_codon:yes stop_codon:yes gene_type:complete